MITQEQTIALIGRANDAGYDNVPEYCAALEAALGRIAAAPHVSATVIGAWAPLVATRALAGRLELTGF